jgi:hypothetical protein
MAPDDSDREREDDPAEGSALSSEELDFTEDEHVKTIDDNRYVVSPDDPLDAAGGSADVDVGDADPTDIRPDSPGTGAAEEPTPSRPEAPRTGRDSPPTDPHERLREDLKDSPHAYGIELSAKLESRVGTHRVHSDDLVHTFESLVLWLSHQIDDRTPPAEVLGILLAESDLTIRYPEGTLASLVDAYDLRREDDIGELLDAIGESGVEFSKD